MTVTATLSAALSSGVTIPLTLTDDSAEPADHGSLASITINACATSGTGSVTTNQDPDTYDSAGTLNRIPVSRACRSSVNRRSRLSSSTRNAARRRYFLSCRSFVRGSVVAGELGPEGRRRVSRERSSCSSWLMASGDGEEPPGLRGHHEVPHVSATGTAGGDVVNALDRSGAARTCTLDSAVGAMSDSTSGPGDGRAGSRPDGGPRPEVCDRLGHGGPSRRRRQRRGRGGREARRVRRPRPADLRTRPERPIRHLDMAQYFRIHTTVTI